MISLAHCKQTSSLLLTYPGKIGNTYPNESRQVECYERANTSSRSNDESAKPTYQEERKPVYPAHRQRYPRRSFSRSARPSARRITLMPDSDVKATFTLPLFPLSKRLREYALGRYHPDRHCSSRRGAGWHRAGRRYLEESRSSQHGSGRYHAIQHRSGWYHSERHCLGQVLSPSSVSAIRSTGLLLA